MIGEVDLHLFNEGTHRRLWDMLGPQQVPADGSGDGSGGGTRFAVWAPNARSVRIHGDWNGWQPLDMQRVGDAGIWAIVVAEAAPGDHYKFAVESADGTVTMKADPMARRSELPPGDASILPEVVTHIWTDGEWMGRRGAVLSGEGPLRIYEVHLSSWRRDLTTWDEIAPVLADHVAKLGFTHVELMPIAEHPFGGSWGYQITGFYSPSARYGDPDGLRRFVDQLHARGVGVILDWVPAHFPRDEWSLGRFDGTALYEHADPRQGEHPDWGTYVFNYARHEVRNFLVANALYWLDEFHIDGLRVDAVASMLYLDYSRRQGEWIPNEQGGRENLHAIGFLREVNSVVAEEHPDVLLVAEESTAWPKVSRPAAEGGLGFTHKWNLGWMHDTLGYFTRDPVHRRHHHRELTFALLYAFNERFVLPLSHDEVVHGKGSLLRKMAGDDWQRFANLRALLAWQWAMPGPPLVFMGTELAPWTEWSEAAGLPWHVLDHAPHRGMLELVHDLNAAADRWPATWRRDDDVGGFEWLDADDADHSMFAFLRWDVDGASVLACLANLTPVPRPGYRVGLPWGGQWRVALDTDLAAYGGSSYRGEIDVVDAVDGEPWQRQGCSAQLDVPPLAVVWLAASSPPRP